MNKPLNKRNRLAARNALRRACDELFRQQVQFWIELGNSPKQARRSARADVTVLVNVHAGVFYR